MEILRYSWQYLKNFKIRLLLYVLITLIVSGITFILPLIIGRFIDQLISNPQINIIYKFIAIFISLNIINLIFNFFSSILGLYIQTHANILLNVKLLDSLKKVPISIIEKEDKSYLAQRINIDTNIVISFAISTINGFITNIFTIISSFVLLYNINKLMCVLLLFLLIIYYLLYKFSKTKIYQANYSSKEYSSKYFSKLHEQISCIKLIKVYNLFDFFEKRFKNSFMFYYKAILNYQVISFFFAGSESLITTLTRGGFYLIGGIQFLNGSISIGLFSALSNYFTSALNSLKYFVNFSQQYLEAKTSFNRLVELEGKNIEINGNIITNDLNTIKLININFSYENNQIFRNFSYEFNKGKIYVIKGENGTGKSTLIELILGLHCNFDGNLLYNDVDLKSMDLYQLRNFTISYIPQKPLLYGGDIKENLLLPYAIDDSDINDLIEKFGLFTDDNKLSLSTYIEETGNNLSGGELQKISIIRELIRKKSVMIFDEPFNSLDKPSQKVLKDKIRALKNNRIIIIISHGNEFDQICDDIIDLNKVRFNQK